ncbi:aminotransferase class V-fold PLP-dependent enzyme [Halobacillus fulvus]|nr:aminotransferase class V-fold PLP-dependent enzyme [Halobacillus fulvus]
MEKYFDFAATTPMSHAALNAFVKASEEYFGNSSSLHDTGSKAGQLLEHCRTRLSEMMGIEGGLYFTSGGTESNAIALQALAYAGNGKHIVTTEAEHSSVNNVLDKLAREGFRVSRLPFTKKGEVDVDRMKEIMNEETALVSVQLVNSDIGTIQPIKEMASLCRQYGSLLHSDAVQAFGKIDIREWAPYVDSLSISAHKVGGPKGVGAVYISPAVSFSPLVPNGTHESGVRPGTVNTPGIASFLVGAEEMVTTMEEHQVKTIALKKTLLDSVANGPFDVVGRVEEPIPILGLIGKGVSGQWMMLEANRRGFCFSTGSACQSKNEGSLPTLTAMGINKEEAEGFIRISFHPNQTREEVIELGRCLTDIVSAYSVHTSPAR